MNTVYDSQSLQSYGLRLQTEARRGDAGRSRSSRTAGRSLAPRLRDLVHRRSS